MLFLNYKQMQNSISTCSSDTNTATFIKLKIAQLVSNLSGFVFTKDISNINSKEKLEIIATKNKIRITISLVEYRKADPTVKIPKDPANIALINKLHTQLDQLLGSKVNLAVSVILREICLKLSSTAKMYMDSDNEYCYCEIYNLTDNTCFTMIIDKE